MSFSAYSMYVAARKIHISELTKAILEEFETFDLQERGQIEIKVRRRY